MSRDDVKRIGPALPAHRIRERKVLGTPYTEREIVLADGRVAYSQLSEYGPGEAEDRIRAFLNPEPPRALPAFSMHGRNTNPNRAGRPRKGAPPRSCEPEDQQ